jgi:hypothetical protein
MEECHDDVINTRQSNIRKLEVSKMYKGKRVFKKGDDVKQILHVDVDGCFESYPCQHNMLVKLSNGEEVVIFTFSESIASWCKEFDFPIDPHFTM